MPNFDGAGPLKRGRVIGRGLGPCKRCDAPGCERRHLHEEKTMPEEKRAD